MSQGRARTWLAGEEGKAGRRALGAGVGTPGGGEPSRSLGSSSAPVRAFLAISASCRFVRGLSACPNNN